MLNDPGTPSPGGIVYFTGDYAGDRAAVSLVPEAADIDLSVAYANGASGAVIVASTEEGNASDYYLNTFIAGQEMIFSSAKGKIVCASSSKCKTLAVEPDGTVRFTAAPIDIKEADDELVTISLDDGSTYKIHTAHQLLPIFEVTGSGVSEKNAGVYAFAVDKFMLRVNTQGELIYARNFNCVGEMMAENFQRHDTPDGVFYSVFVELRPQYRNVNGGYSSGFYYVMDEDYGDADEMHLLANADEKHAHGEGYLDQHEFVVVGEKHYLTLSYTLEKVSNLPEDVEGICQTRETYVWAGIMQEVKNGKVLNEIDTTDYPFLYQSAVESRDYANSTLDGVTVKMGPNEKFSFADGIMDYVHVNSIDYTLNAAGETDKILVSMRNQSAVYQFDLRSGKIDWILGGKASTVGGYDEYARERTDNVGNVFSALMFGQHFARYCNLDKGRRLNGKPLVSIFDNQTGTGPFITTTEICQVPTLTRVFRAEVDLEAGKALISDVIDGLDLNPITGKYHIASHCGSVQYDGADSVIIGWGLHGIIDNIGEFAPMGTFSDPAAGFADLRQGSRPVFSEYDPTRGSVTFELTVRRNPGISSHEGLFSYRTYKTVN